MKNRILSISVVVCFLMLCIVPPISNNTMHTDISLSDGSSIQPIERSLLSSAGSNGNDISSVAFMSRTVADQQLLIANTYGDTSSHNGTLDLSSYQIAGWTLYNVTMETENLTAAPELESIGSGSDATYPFRIQEYSAPYRYTNLTQGFYNQAHNGSMVNISLLYQSPSYDPTNQGYAYVAVVSDYSDYSSNMTTYVSLSNVGTTSTWRTVTSSANLTENTEYFFSIDGSLLHENAGVYPWLRWLNQAGAGDCTTRRFNTDGDTWGSNLVYEAFLNYTYIPWNQSLNSALTFQPIDIQMRGNTTSLSGSSWTWTSSQNITSIAFDSNQSIYLNHDLTLWYKKDVQTQTTWDVLNSGDNVDWNATTTLSYPISQSEKFLSITIASDWTETGLYNSSNPSINYNNHTRYGNVIQCANLTDGTWTLTSTAHNYLTSILSLDTISILDDLSITSLVRDGGSINATTGSTNLTIWQDTSRIDTIATTETVTNGATEVIWDVDSDTSNNGTFRIEVFWTNGTEAGYLTREFVVFYPTELTATSYSIQAYTEDSFEIRVFNNDTFNDQGLTYALGSIVTFSYNGNTNLTMTDLLNGTWTANIPTAGNSSGVHSVDVFSEGFAIENQTLSISVSLLHDTLPLVGTWSQPYEDNITYIQSTNLTILYQRIDGTNVTDAMVNVTIDGTTYDFNFDPISETYWIQFNGSDFSGFSTFPLSIEAWKAGYVPRTNSSLSLIVREQPTTLTLDWTLITIDYLGQIDLTVEYWYGGTAVPASSPNVNMTIDGGLPILLTQVGDYWTANLTGVYLDLGSHNIVVYAWAYGYISQSDIATLTVNEVVTDPLGIIWEPANVTLPYTSALNLTLEYQYNTGIDVIPAGAMVNVTIDGMSYDLAYVAGSWYVSISGSAIGIGVYDATISAWKYGFTQQTNITLSVNVTLASNSFVVEWIPIGLDITYAESVWINVTYTANFIPISGATVQLFINGTRIHDLTYNDTTEKWEIILSGSYIALGNWNFTVKANKTGYDTGIETQYLTVDADACSAIPNWTDEILYYTHTLDLNVTVLDSYGQPSTTALVNATFQGTNYTMVHLGSGVYRLIFNGTDASGAQQIEINTFEYGYINQTFNVDLQFANTPTDYSITTLIGSYSSSIVYYDGWIGYSYYLNDTDGNPLPAAIVTLNGITMTSLGNGTHSLNITASDWGVGNHTVTIIPSLTGYQFTVSPSQLEIKAVPTRIEFTTIPSIMFINDTVLVEVEYVNEHTELGIVPSSLTITWMGLPATYQSLGQGLYRINVNTSSLSPASYELSVQFGFDNYTIASRQWPITVRAVNTWLVIEHPSYAEYENETLSLHLWYTDADHDAPIYWAVVNVTLDVIYTYSMEYIGDGEYFVEIYLGTRAPGEYTLRFEAEAEGCAFNFTTIALNILAKTQYLIAFEIGSAIQGATLGVTVTMSHPDAGVDVGGLSITVFVLMIDENGDSTLRNGTGITSSAGVTQVTFDIPLGIQSINVSAYFAGSISEWYASTGERTFAVSPPGGLLESLADFFLGTRLGNIIIFLIILSFVVGAYYTKAMKPKRIRKHVNYGKQYDVYKELASLRHFMAVYRNRGTCVFYHPFTEERIQPDLLSGFISAMTSVFGEIKGDGLMGTLEVVQYEGLFLHNYSSKNLIGILILEEEMSPALNERLTLFIEMFENEYSHDLTEWNGQTDCFNPEWIVSTLNSVLGYHLRLPHKVVLPAKSKGREKKILELIVKAKDDRGEIFLSDLIPPLVSLLKEPEEVVYDILLSLRENGLLVPISVQNVLLRQGMGIVDGSVDVDEDLEPESEPVVESSEDLDEDIETPEVTEVVETELEPGYGETKEVDTKEEPEKEISPEESFIAEVESKLKEKESKKGSKDEHE